MKILRYAIAAVILLTFAVTVLTYPQLPDPIVAHWNAAGEADGTMPKFWGLALIPALSLGLTALFFVLPRIDPLRKNYEAFRTYYEGMILVFLGYMLVIQLLIIVWNLGYRISPNTVFPPLIGVLFIYIGFMIEHAEQNWFVGIRTPWTLSSATVWKKTHELAGKLFKIAGIVAFAGLLVPQYAIWFVLVPCLSVRIFTVIYSYLIYRRETSLS
jgi:uncharacterized membrane protein